MYNGAARHLHDIKDEKRHKEHLERRAEEELLQNRKQEQGRLRAKEEYRRQTQSMRYGTRTPVIARTPTTTWIEDAHDVRDLRSNSSMLVSPIVLLGDDALTASRLSHHVYMIISMRHLQLQLL